MKFRDPIDLGWVQIKTHGCMSVDYCFGKNPEYIMRVAFKEGKSSDVTIKRHFPDNSHMEFEYMQFVMAGKVRNRQELEKLMGQIGIIPEPSLGHAEIVSLGWKEFCWDSTPTKLYYHGDPMKLHHEMKVSWFAGVGSIEIKLVDGVTPFYFNGTTVYRGNVHSIDEMRNVMAMVMGIGVYAPTKVTCGLFPWITGILHEQKEQDVKRERYVKSITRKYEEEVREILRKADERQPLDVDLTSMGIGVKQPVSVVTRMKGGGFQINADYCEIINYKDGELTIKLKDK